MQEASSEKLVLKVVETPDAPAAQTAAQLTTLPPVALPNGATARLFVEPDDEAGGRAGRRIGPERSSCATTRPSWGASTSR